MTRQKKVRNVIYRICGWGMIGLLVLLIALVLLKAPGWVVMVIEVLLLHLFGFAWVVKGEFFPFLNDKEDLSETSGSALPPKTRQRRMEVEE